MDFSLAGDVIVVTNARAQCAWAAAHQAITDALCAAVNAPVDNFFAALVEAWRRHVEVEDRGGRALTTAQTPQSPISPRPKSRSSSASGPRSARSEEGCRQPENHSDTSFASSSSEGNGFAEWLAERPPLFRFEHGARGLAWDCPTSKAEKRELLLLQLFAEEGERQAQMACLQDSKLTAFACQPHPQCPRR
jgi:hypothetical protein